MISERQHGFLPNRSTVTQLLDALNEWMEAYHENKQIDAVYTDIAKAFDTVTHPKLLEVIRSYGIGNNLYNWIKSFLSNRIQLVRVDNSFSNPAEVVSGIPQGSVIGPLFFILYMDDINKVVSENTTVSLFADDAKFSSTSCEDLQKSLDNIKSFFDTRQLNLAKEKCEHITFSKKPEPTTFYLSKTPINKTTMIKDLGIFICSDLKWQSHTNYLKLRAYQKCYLILRTFSTKNIWTLVQVYTTYVRPVLETGSIIWSPQFCKDIRSIEQVQRYYTKKIFRKCNIPYTSYMDRLNKINMKTLEYRRCAADITMVYKIINNLVDLPFNKYFKLFSSPYDTRRHPLCLKLNSSVSNHHDSYFSRRVVPLWNKLPHDLVLSKSLNDFTRNLKQFNLAKICKFIYS